MSSGVLSNLTLNNNYYIDPNGAVFANVLNPIADFPYFQRSTAIQIPNQGTVQSWKGTDYNDWNYAITRDIPDLGPIFNYPLPQSFKTDGVTSCTWYRYTNYTGPTMSRGPNSAQRSTWDVGYSFASIRIFTASTVFSAIQQVGTYLGGKFIFWGYADVITNMKNLVYTQQNSNPSKYTGALVQSLIATISALDCPTVQNNVVPPIATFCDTYNAEKAAAVAAAALAAQVAAETKAVADAKAAAAAAAALATQNAATAAAAIQKAKVDAEAKAEAAAKLAAGGTVAPTPTPAAGSTTTPTTTNTSTGATTTTTTTGTILGINKWIFIGAVIAAIIVLSASGYFAFSSPKKKVVPPMIGGTQ